MQQIISITDARNNLSKLVNQVSKQNTQIIIVRESRPEAVLMSYKEYLKKYGKHRRL